MNERGAAGSNRADYGGEHSPPGPGSGAPLHDLTGGGQVYPDDIYSPRAVQYYGTGEPALDRQTNAIIQGARGRPGTRITIYRAVPDDLTAADKIAKLERQQAQIQRRGLPGMTPLQSSQVYNKNYAELERLRAIPIQNEAAPSINAGDWVTINRRYAQEHGASALRGNYRIIRKTVPARELFTNGDSWHEFGYWPNQSPGVSGVSILAPLAGLAGAGFTVEALRRKRP